MNVCEHNFGGEFVLIAEDQGGKICRGQWVVFVGVGRSDDVSRPALRSLGFYLGVTSGSQ